MRIVHLAAEFAPIAKAGGLGEVLLGLSREQTKKGHDVDVILPKYDSMNLSQIRNLSLEVPDFQCLENKNAIWFCRYEECHLHLLDSRHPAGFFHRGKIYGFEDDVTRFAYFSRAALEYLSINPKPIDILHLHDWHVSLCAVLAKTLFKKVPIKAIVLSIHNIEYQGRCAGFDLDRVGMRDYSLLKDEQYPDSFNLLKGGILFSDGIIPVSPSYAKEIFTKEGGLGLEKTLFQCRSKVRGILNGIDIDMWNPRKDPHLVANYDTHSLSRGKEVIRKGFKLDAKKRPWIGTVSRLVPQKGPELLEEAIETTLQLGGCFLLLGSSPIPDLQEHFNQLKKKYEGNRQVFLHYQYSDPLAHQIYAALDFLLVPSHFEPCGLTQMIGMLYGTVPIVRATGGLKDTVFDCDNPTITVQKRNGFSFPMATKDSMNETVKRGFDLFQKDPATFQALQKRGMESDFSWEKPTREYLKFYTQILLKSAFNMDPIRKDIITDRNCSIKSNQRNSEQTDLLK